MVMSMTVMIEPSTMTTAIAMVPGPSPGGRASTRSLGGDAVVMVGESCPSRGGETVMTSGGVRAGGLGIAQRVRPPQELVEQRLRGPVASRRVDRHAPGVEPLPRAVEAHRLPDGHGVQFRED